MGINLKKKVSLFSIPSELKKKVVAYWPLLFLIVYFFAFYFEVFIGEKSIPYDATTMFFPNWSFAVSQYRSGSLPLWNPYVFSGYPYFADPQGGAFSPLIMSLLAIPKTLCKKWFDIIEIGHLCLGGIFLYLCCRQLRLSKEASLLAGILIIGGGSGFSRLQHSPQIFGYGYLPVVFYFLLLLLKQPRLRIAIGLGLISGCFASIPSHVTYLGTLFLNAFILKNLYEGFKAGDRLFRKKIYLLILAGVIALIICSPQLYGILLMLPIGNRSVFSYEAATRFSMSPHYLLTLIIPDFFGSLSGDYWGPFDITESYFYFGMAPVALCITVCFKKSFRLNSNFWFFFLSAVFFAIYSVGKHSPLFHYIYNIPGVSLFRRPEDGTYLLTLCVSILTAYLMDLSLAAKTDNSNGNRFSSFSIERYIFRFLSLGIVFFFVTTIIDGINLAVERMKLSAVLISSGISLFIIAIVFLILYAHGKLVDKKQKLITYLILILCCANLLVVSSRYSEFALSRETARLVVYLEQHPENLDVRSYVRNYFQNNAQPYGRVEVLNAELLPWNWAAIFKTQVTGGYNPLTIKRYSNLTEHYHNYQLLDFNNAIISNYKSPLFNLLSTPLIVTRKSSYQKLVEERGEIFPNHFTLLRDGYYQVYENKRALPRAFWVRNAYACTSEEECKTILTNENFDPSEHVILEGVDGEKLPDNILRWKKANNFMEAPKGNHNNPRIKITSYQENKVVIEVEASDEGYLVLTDNYFPGWRARVNDKIVPIYRADYTFRGVYLEAGKNMIVFSFEPFSFERLKKMLKLLW